MHITPLTTASSHVRHDPRTQAAAAQEGIARLIQQVERASYTLVPLDLHYKNGLVKLEVGLAKGQKLHDKRAGREEEGLGRKSSA